jgi:hypothetical protein
MAKPDRRPASQVSKYKFSARNRQMSGDFRGFTFKVADIDMGGAAEESQMTKALARNAVGLRRDHRMTLKRLP